MNDRQLQAELDALEQTDPAVRAAVEGYDRMTASIAGGDVFSRHSEQCENCDGSGFVMLYDYYGPGDHDEDNCCCINALSGSDPNAELCDACHA